MWERDRAELLKLTGKPATFAERLVEIEAEMARYLDDLETLLADPEGPIRIDDAGELSTPDGQSGVRPRYARNMQ